MLTTTFRLAKKAQACETRYHRFAKAVGGIKTYGQDTPIPVSKILEVNGLQDALWVLEYAIPKEQEAERDRVCRLFKCDVAEHVLHLFEVAFPNDKRSREYIEVSRRYALGEATNEELTAAGDARGAARAAAGDARGTAGDTAGAAARAAARAAWGTARAAWDTARDTAGDAARAARGAARDAWDTAWDTAGDAAWNAAAGDARGAAGDAARAAWDTARDAEHEWQSRQLAKFVESET